VDEKLYFDLFRHLLAGEMDATTSQVVPVGNKKRLSLPELNECLFENCTLTHTRNREMSRGETSDDLLISWGFC